MKIFIPNLLTFFALAYFIGNPLYGQESFDANAFENRLDSPDGYKLRKSRYEGLYNKPYSKPVISIVSLLLGDLEYDLSEKEVLYVGYPKINILGDIGVTGQSYGLSLNYHIDFILSPGKKIAVPVKDVILRKNIYSSNLGMFGYTGKISIPSLYIPISVSRSPERSLNQKKEPLSLTMICSAPLSSVSWTYSKVENENTCGSPQPGGVINKTFLDGSPIKMELQFSDNVKTGEILCIDITGVVRGQNKAKPLLSYKMVVVQ